MMRTLISVVLRLETWTTLLHRQLQILNRVGFFLNVTCSAIENEETLIEVPQVRHNLMKGNGLIRTGKFSEINTMPFCFIPS
jgi:hypothetical protein